MKKHVEQLYELMYSPIITPYNLLENAKLDNYSYVNYYKGVRGLIAEMKCITKYNQEAVFYYLFDENDHLYKIEREMCKEKEIMFDREEEIVRVKIERIDDEDNKRKVV
ncbi:hypothetical protein KPL37_15080 [Clostridium frigoris]|uniref:Uncharacterized protein n=1 Tax=Clostridium frigoris TaxID=205327 RepID=A0ABS6BVU4_9CLOT|nr:hypothetical protein [Clostridium frigoris]MBU3161048.1 hypothetical protein [Clostridium frigoris]